MTERELPPYKATHNLLKPPKLAPPREAGDEPEALHGGTHKTRIARYRKAIRTLERLIADDLDLERRVRTAAKTPLPSGSAEGSRHSGISDPTAKAAERGRIKDPAERAWDSADTATHALWWAVRHLNDIARLAKADTPEAKARYAKEIRQLANRAEADLVDTGCTNCAKVGEYSPRGEPPAVPTDSTLCRWCHEFKREHGVEPPRALTRKHHRGERIYTRDVDKELHGVRPSQARN